MEIFVIAAALAFVLYECIAFAQWPVLTQRFAIGVISVRYEEGTVAWARRFIRAILVVVVLVCILFLHGAVFPPNATISAYKANIILGFMFGPMLGIWINSVLRHDASKGLTRGQLVGGVGLILFFIVGSVGKEAGKLIEQLAGRVGSVKVAGAEFQFTGGVRRAPAPVVAPSATVDARGTGTILMSSGLWSLSNLNLIIRRDRGFRKAFGVPAPALDPLEEKLDAAETFASRMVVPPFKCLAGWLRATADETSVNSHLAAFASVFRQVGALDINQRENEVSEAFINRSLAVAADVLVFERPAEVVKECEDLLKEFCKKGTTSPVESQSQMLGCKPSRSQDDPPLDKLVGEYAKYLSQFSKERAAETRPYFAIAYASLMAQLGQYGAAEEILYNWLATKKKRLKSTDGLQEYDDWFELRIRIMIAIYFDEWIKRDSEKILTVVRDEHLKNLDIIRRKEGQRLASSSLFYFQLLQRRDDNSRLVLTRPVPRGCHDHDTPERVEPRRLLFWYHVSMELMYLQNTLAHPEYDTRFAEPTSGDLKWLAQLDLSCLPDKGDMPITYAQILEAYGHNAVRYTLVKGPLESADSRKQRLEDAVHAVQVGLTMLPDTADSEQAGQAPNFLSRVNVTEAATTREALKQDLKDLEAALKPE